MTAPMLARLSRRAQGHEENNVPFPIISGRLGYSNILTMLWYYLVITPEVERLFGSGKL